MPKNVGSRIDIINTLHMKCPFIRQYDMLNNKWVFLYAMRKAK